MFTLKSRESIESSIESPKSSYLVKAVALCISKSCIGSSYLIAAVQVTKWSQAMAKKKLKTLKQMHIKVIKGSWAFFLYHGLNQIPNLQINCFSDKVTQATSTLKKICSWIHFGYFAWKYHFYKHLLQIWCESLLHLYNYFLPSLSTLLF